MDIYSKITGIGLSVMLCGCQHTGQDTFHSTSTTDVMNDTEKDYISREKARLKALLDQFSLPLEDETPAMDFKDKGALCAMGYRVKGKPIRVMTWLFRDQNAHAAIFEQLSTTKDSEKYFVQFSSNGGWLAWVYSVENDPALEDLIYELVGALAGEE